MQKTLDILEKNVQWFVLGLAGLFLLWVAYAYVLTPPATIKVGTQEVNPGNVSQIVKSSADRLNDQIKNAAAPTFPTSDLVTNWKTHMEKPFGEELVQGGKYVDFVPQPNTGPGGPTLSQQVKLVEALPVPPVAVLLQPVVGLSTVSTVPPNAPNNPAPAQNPNQPVAQQSKDTPWIMIPAGISGPALAKAMLAPLSPQQQQQQWVQSVYNTTLLQVVLERQKSNGVDANGLPTFPADDQHDEVKPLVIYQPQIQPLPTAAQGVNAEFQYVNWAQQRQDLIGGPQLGQVVAGDPWAAPQLPQGGVTAPVAPPPTTPASASPPGPASTTEPPAKPATPAPVAPPAAAPKPAPPATTPRPSAAPSRNTNTRHYAPYDPARPTGMMLALGDPGSGYHTGPLPGTPGAYRPGPLPGAQGAVPFDNGANPGGNFNGNGGQAQGVLNPFQINTDVLVWAIDETAVPGETYRYRVVYKLKNPVFGVTNLAPEKLVNQLTIDSPPSLWTAPIKAPEMTKFWLVDADTRNEKAKVDVFHYSKGSWQARKSIPLQPGDQIPDRNLTVVDVRTGDHREKYVLLASDAGDMLRRDVAQDAADPDHQTMLNPPNPNGGPAGAPERPVGLNR
ncbi:MAG TPA: hypothetical protein VGI81_12660 [Tepidisphaeraceae bacterium]|jgi:hypothetical protein